MIASNLSGHVQRFFTERLTSQLGASPHTVASYRDTFRLLLVFASKHRRRPASDLRLEDLDAKLVAAFLRHLEHDRGNGARSRNNRLSAIHAFFRQVYLQEPALAHHCQQVLAVPFKRFERGPVGFLSADESVALLNAPDTTTWRGRRDRLLLQSTRPLSGQRAQGPLYTFAPGSGEGSQSMACAGTSGPDQAALSNRDR